ncbi:MAG: ABC transporter ATP-binding protein [Planctomycetes bacterium]|nr:ABC transporter ATP-binding protein [Planctomycetota bacterium]MBI3835546.1 ABC transporter ATP-binding protein [Planctomycetota bacterium]
MNDRASTTQGLRESRKTDADARKLVARLVDIYKRFGPLIVLEGINLDLVAGQTTVIIGESGSGKSVLLNHLVRLLKPDRGEVYFHEQRIDNISERQLSEIRPHMGFLFQGSALFDSMNVGENIAFPIVEHTKRIPSEVDKIVARKLALVGLEGIQRKMPSELSGGQKKRVALARAIALDPEMILYDEPTTGLDPPRSDEIDALIGKLQKELGVTSVVVTHDMATVRKVADRVIMLYKGRFIFDGKRDEVFQSEDERVRNFVEGRSDPAMLAALRKGV